jgi:hypothetical protein
MFIFFQLLILNIMKILFQALSSKLLVPAVAKAESKDGLVLLISR